MDLTATSSNDNPAIWSVNVPGNAAYITGTSVAVTVSAAKTGYAAPSPHALVLAVDLVAPTAPAYTAPGSLKVGVAIAAVSPSGGSGSGIDEYGATGLPSGLSIDPFSGVISGTPDRANASTASATVTVTDTADNAATVLVAFPVVAKGDQTLTGFQYSSNTVTLGSTAPTVTAPSGAQGALSYSVTASTVCAVGSSTGVLTLVGVGECEVIATAADTADYNQATATYTVTVQPVAEPPASEVIAPTAIVQTAGVRAESGYAASHLIDGSGLSESPTVDNLSNVTHADPTAVANPNTGWRTAADGLVPNVLVTPVSITQTQGDTQPTFGYAPGKLIDGSGLSATPTAENWASVAHPWVGGAAAWTTNTTGSPHYFSNSSNPQPQFELDLGESHNLTGLVVWGANRSEAALFEVSFSTDGGTTYGAAVTVTTGRFVGPASQHLVFPGEPRTADHVRLTITGTVSSLGYTSRAGGGDRVALSELRFTGVSSVAPQTRFVLDLVPNVLVTPVFITQTQGDTRPDYGYAPEKLIDGSGLSSTPTAENWASVAHPWVGGAAAWSTDAQGNPHYFSNTSNPQPQFELDLGGSHRLTGLVVWGAQDLENEAALFEVSFSTDGGATYGGSVTVTTGGHVGQASRLMRFPGGPHAADHVRLTITGNDKSVGYPAVRGGGGVSLAELRLLGKAAADTHRLSGLVVWGFGGSLDEASDFSLEFSTDSGIAYGGVVETVQTSSLLGMGNELLAFATPRTANQVRLTVTENAQGRGWTGPGGAREGLGELRLVKMILTSMTITSVAMHPTKDAFQVTIAFSAPVTGFTIDDISVANGSKSGFTGTGTTYTVLVTPTSGVDDVTVAVAEDVAVGDNGNGNASASKTFEVDTKAPTFQAASVTGNMLVLTYDENLDPTSTPATSAFAVTAGPSGSLVPVALAASGAVTVSGRTVTLKLANPVSAAHGVKVVYTVPTAPNAAKLQDALGNPEAALTVTTVTNNTEPPTVSVSPTKLSIDEGATGTYTVVLDSAPVAEVTVTPARSRGDTDVTVSRSLTFTASTWAVGQTVTVMAGQDEDALNETAVIGNTVSGDDYGNASVTAADVSVTVNDDETATVGPPTSFTAGDLTVNLDGQGRIASLRGTDQNNYLASGYTPALLKFVVTDSPSDAASAAEQLLPLAASFSDGVYTLFYDHDIQASVALVEMGNAGFASLELESLSNPGGKDIRVAMWGPYELTIGEQVADVVGIAYSRDYAIGIQALNVKTFAGAPYEFTDSNHISSFDHSERAVDPLTGLGIGGSRASLNKYWLRAASLTPFGSVLQAYSRDYTASRVMKTAGIDRLHAARHVDAITDSGHPLYPYRTLTGSKIALFGLQRRGVEGGGLNRRQVFKNEILKVIRAMEIGEGLPYSTGDGGVWSRFARDSRQKILHVGVSNSVQYLGGASSALSAGLNSIYTWQNPGGIFRHEGFVYEPKHGSYDSLSREIQNLRRQGVRFGNHILPGFAYVANPGTRINNPATVTPVDRYVRTRARDLATYQRSTLASALTPSGTTIVVEGRDYRFREFYSAGGSTPRGNVLIGNEIIAYTGAEDHGTGDTRLTGAIRGAFGTTATGYGSGTDIGILTKYMRYFNAFAWGAAGVVEMGEAVGSSINRTGMSFISLDGIESYWYEMYNELGANVFYKTLFDTMTSKELSGEASRLWHYNWHFHDRWMWGEKDSQVLKGTFDFQLANATMLSRNFLPLHTGGFFGSNNTWRDFEWIGSKIAAMDSGTLIRSQGLDAAEKAALKRWIEAADAGAFSDYHRVRMGPWERAFALEEVNNGSADWTTGQRWRLKERAMTLTYDKANELDDDANSSRVAAVSYGSESNPFYVARPWAGFPTRNVAGDALVSTSSKRDAGYQGDNAVDGFIGMFNPGKYNFCVGGYYRDLDDDGERKCRRRVSGSISEWHTASADSERWIKLTWDRPQKIRTVFLSDRSHPDNNVTGYTIEFEDGTMLSGTNLPVRGAYRERSVSTGSVESSWVKVSITTHDGSNPGLGEVVVIAEDPNFKGHLAKNATILERPRKP